MACGEAGAALRSSFWAGCHFELRGVSGWICCAAGGKEAEDTGSGDGHRVGFESHQRSAVPSVDAEDAAGVGCGGNGKRGLAKDGDSAWRGAGTEPCDSEWLRYFGFFQSGQGTGKGGVA